MRTFDATDIRHLQVELGNATVTLRPSEDGQLHGEVKADHPELEQRLSVETFGSELRVTAPSQDRRWSSTEVRMDVRIPAGIDLTLSLGSGDLISDVALGRVTVKSGSGDLRLAGVGAARLTTGSGDIVALDIAGEAELSSGSGDIRVDRAAASLNLRTASGDVSIGALHGRAEAKLASGDFHVGSTTGSVSVRTASGDIYVGVADELPAWLDLHSGSGDVGIDIPATGEPEPGVPFISIYARTGSGDIRIQRA